MTFSLGNKDTIWFKTVLITADVWNNIDGSKQGSSQIIGRIVRILSKMNVSHHPNMSIPEVDCHRFLHLQIHPESDGIEPPFEADQLLAPTDPRSLYCHSSWTVQFVDSIQHCPPVGVANWSPMNVTKGHAQSPAWHYFPDYHLQSTVCNRVGVLNSFSSHKSCNQ